MDELTLDEVQGMIIEECDFIRALLLNKNKKYGNSAVSPKRIFSTADAVEQIKVRIDDKLSRIQNSGLGDDSEDSVQDLIGYLLLLKVAQRLKEKYGDQKSKSL